MSESNIYPWIVKRDIDGFFGLAIDNLIQFLLIASLCPVIVGIPAEFVFTRILPGAALSLVFGNLFYSWQARKLARKEKRRDVTALPYGINTVSFFAYLIFIMGPVYRETGSYEIAWKVGLLACFFEWDYRIWIGILYGQIKADYPAGGPSFHSGRDSHNIYFHGFCPSDI